MKIIAPLAAAALLTLLNPSAYAQSQRAQQPTPTQQEQKACEDDAFKFCQDAMPDEARVYACLKSHRKQLNSICRGAIAKYRPPPAKRAPGSRPNRD